MASLGELTEGGLRGYVRHMQKRIVDIREAEAHFAELTPLIREGQVITLWDKDRPLAEIHPLPRPATTRRPFGLGRGSFTVPEDFGKADPDIERMFYGDPA